MSSSLFRLPLPPRLGRIAGCLFLVWAQACGSNTDGDLDSWSVEAGDCNDADADIHPGTAELCDGVDNDCDGTLDEDLPLLQTYPDTDGDGFGLTSQARSACDLPEGWTISSGDCDDADPAVHPGATELCNEQDEDCDGRIDEGVTLSQYADADQDGYGDLTTTLEACTLQEGYLDVAGDCNDQDPLIHPGAEEVCDGWDNDCDGYLEPVTYPDDDGDGFGDPTRPLPFCQPGAQVSKESTLEVGYDCDDADPAIHPGAADASSDGIDQDCGGTEDAEPSVGLEASTFTSIQLALDAALDGTTVWVGPGTYLARGLTFRGRPLALRGTHGAALTRIDGENQGVIFLFSRGEGRASVLSGFTLAHGQSDKGGGLLVVSSSPTLQSLILEENQADEGAGAYIWEAAPLLGSVTLRLNQAEGAGAGLYLWNSQALLAGLTAEDNRSRDSGGGLYIGGGTTVLTDFVVQGNQALHGGGISTLYADLDLARGVVQDNAADTASGLGGGLDLYGSSLTLENVTLRYNQAFGGGAAYLEGSAATLNTVAMRHNQASACGAFCAYHASRVTLDHGAIVSNTSASFGAMLLWDESAAHITHSVIAYNPWANLSRLDDGCPFILSDTILYNPPGLGVDSLTPEGDYLNLEPAFLAYELNGAPCLPDDSPECLPSDLHAAVDSPMVDAGSVENPDVDGSPEDLGIYGGARGATWDRDRDGFPAWFWPGAFADAPEGVDTSSFDCDDDDPLITSCY